MYSAINNSIQIDHKLLIVTNPPTSNTCLTMTSEVPTIPECVYGVAATWSHSFIPESKNISHSDSLIEAGWRD